MSVELRGIEQLRSVLERAPLGILSDIDGTLSPIVDDARAASISPAALQALRQLIARGVRVALITGRSLDQALEMVQDLDVCIAANHGLELWINGSNIRTDESREYLAGAGRVLDEIGPSLTAAGVTIEDKGPVLAFHYRQASEQAAARDSILTAIKRSKAASAFRTHEGRKVIELRPPLPANKGTAAAELVRMMDLESVICMGDDATDIDMFRSIQRLRRQGLGAVNVGVQSAEATLMVIESTDYWVRGVEGVEWLLTEVLRALPAPGSLGR